MHLAINSGTDLALFNAWLTYINEKGLTDKAFIAASTKDFDKAVAANKTSLEEAAQITGLTVDQIRQSAEWIAQPKQGGARRRTMFAYEKGLIWGNDNYRTNGALVNVALATGNIGRPGGGLRAHGWASGGLFAAVGCPCRATGRLRRQAADRGQRRRAPHLGLRSLQDDAQRAEVQAGLQEAHRHGEGRHVRRALRRSQRDRSTPSSARSSKGGLFAVDVDIIPTKIGQACHVWLPAATSGEANLTSMNGERRMRLTERYMDPPGQAMPDCLIAARIANHMERVLREQGKSADTPTSSRASTGRPKKTPSWTAITKHEKGGEFVTYERLRAMGTNGFQEPAVDFKDGKIVGTKRLYADGKFGGKDGKATFMETKWRGLQAPGKEAEKNKWPFLINNGRTNHVWQNAYLDQQNDFVMDRWPYPFIQMNPQDMAELNVKAGDLVEVYNDNGSTQAIVYPTPTAKRKQTFMLFAYPTGVQGNVVSAGVNEFIIPNYKQTWGGIRKIADAPEAVRHLTFKSEEYSRG